LFNCFDNLKKIFRQDLLGIKVHLRDIQEGGCSQKVVDKPKAKIYDRDMIVEQYSIYRTYILSK